MKVSAFATTAASCITQRGKTYTSTCLTCQSTDAAENIDSSRRTFLRNTSKVGVAAGAASVGWFANLDMHSDGCLCFSCSGDNASGSGEGFKGIMNLGPLPSHAYERDVGDSGRSADTFAQNLQVRTSKLVSILNKSYESKKRLTGCTCYRRKRLMLDLKHLALNWILKRKKLRD